MILKRSFAIVLVLAVLLGLTACGVSKQKSEPLEKQISNTAEFLLESSAKPVCGSVCGDWVAFGLARWGGEVPGEWYDAYYSAVEDYVTQVSGVLSDRKYTEYSRVILALTAIGKDPANVAGYNLLIPLADYEQTLFQGINGPIYALLALDSGSYQIPENAAGTTQATREMYVDYILSKEIPGGGWSLTGGEAEIDLTAMALQALAKYCHRQDVADAVERALVILSEQQNQDGGYTAYGSDSCETVAQVTVAVG